MASSISKACQFQELCMRRSSSKRLSRFLGCQSALLNAIALILVPSNHVRASKEAFAYIWLSLIWWALHATCYFNWWYFCSWSHLVSCATWNHCMVIRNFKYARLVITNFCFCHPILKSPHLLEEKNYIWKFKNENLFSIYIYKQMLISKKALIIDHKSKI
jgi:hypothetical protein